ncbi:IS1634 family transposase, partial [Synergistaceae bacterium OttesenSCG-928-I11]|nr:IS1634 family transposase [Synergistaceae bacterium OttesenSCG-928-I11]
MDEETREILPTRRKKPVNAPQQFMRRRFCGATYLFDAIGEKSGVTEDLKRSFPDHYKEILSVAYYLILEDRNPLSRFPRWSLTHKHPCGKEISSQQSSDLFASITEEGRERFFRLQGKRRVEQEFWAYDTTSISSYSTCLKQVRYGVNKDDEPLPQINLALLFGEQSNLPFYYRKLPGNISDVKTVKGLLSDMDILGYKKIKLVMDRGFYSEENINALYGNHLKFLIAAKKSLILVKSELEKVRQEMHDWRNYSEKHGLYMYSVPLKWNYSQKRPYKGDVLHENRRLYLHFYYSGDRALDDEKCFNGLLCALQQELVSGKRRVEHEKQYAKYFDIKATPKRGIRVTPKQDVIDAVKRNYGYFVLMSNEVKESSQAIDIYRNKDLVEKAFGDLKNRLNFNRAHVSSDQSFDGKLFVEFIALIYLSYIKKRMQEKGLFKNYSMHELLDELDLIECCDQQA